VTDVTGGDVAGTFLRWTFVRAVCHRGYVLVSGLYFVITAQLSASELLVLGTVVSVTLLVSDIPTGVWSDAVSRKWPLVAGHAFLATGMAMTGLVSAFPLLVITQVLWGVGWGFSSGADVAWITDELGQPGRIAKVLTARARWESAGGAVGMVTFGVLGWAAGLATALRLVETRIGGAGVARRAYVFSCLVGVAGLVVLAGAPGRARRLHRRAAGHRDRVHRDPCSERDLGQPAHEQRRPGHRALVSVPGRVRR